MHQVPSNAVEYQALYRKYRPQQFDDVIGQRHVTATVAHEITDGTVAHAYLFAGPRGTGKTTTARLLAKALNCTDLGGDGEPCSKCDSCVAIAAGTSLDVIELDAASHNKVEDIREIRVNVGTVAAEGTRRIYILDEAHMLSRAAGNALLKTLEEPPDHVVFVLATTEPYKLLDTIRSRAQRFDFHPVPAETLVDYLALIGDKEGFAAHRDALTVIATHANGSVRDAMSLLEQVAALGSGTVEAGEVARALGLSDQQAFSRLAAAIAEQDAADALGLVAELSSQGADLRRFAAEAVSFFRGVFLAQYAPNLEEVADEPLEMLEEWRRQATMLEPADVLRAVDQLGETLFELRQGREERLVIELAVIKLTRPETALDAGAVVGRLDRLEARMRELATQVAVSPPITVAAAVAPAAAVVAEAPRADPSDEPGSSVVENVAEPDDPPETADDDHTAASASPLDLGSLKTAWPAIVARVRDEAGPRRHALLKEAAPIEVREGAILLEVPSHLVFHLEQLRDDSDLQAAIAALVLELTGSTARLDFVAGEDDEATIGEPARAPSSEDLLEEGDDQSDPTKLVVDMLGGEVVSD